MTSAKAMFNRIERLPAYRAVSDEMERLIVQGRLRQGSELPSEQDLAAQFGVNRSTVREAIRLLEQEGLVTRQGGRRLFVSMPGIVDLAPRAARSLVLNQVTFEELWQVALVVDPEVCRLAALNAASGDLAAIRANLAAAESAAGQLPRRAPLSADSGAERIRGPHPTAGDRSRSRAGIERQAELDVEFHALVALAARNRALMLAREPFSILYRPALRLILNVVPQAAARNLEAHRRIAAALEARDAELAHEWMRKHLVDFRRGFELAELPMDTPLDRLQQGTVMTTYRSIGAPPARGAPVRSPSARRARHAPANRNQVQPRKETTT